VALGLAVAGEQPRLLGADGMVDDLAEQARDEVRIEALGSRRGFDVVEDGAFPGTIPQRGIGISLERGDGFHHPAAAGERFDQLGVSPFELGAKRVQAGVQIVAHDRCLAARATRIPTRLDRG
jgi:hypothetical protein